QLADAIVDDGSGKASKIGNTKPASVAPSGPSAGWPGAAPGAPHYNPASGTTQPSAPAFQGQYPGAPAGSGHYSSGPGAPGPYPTQPSGPGAPGPYPAPSSGPGAPGPYPAPSSGPGAPGPYPAPSSGPGAPGPYPVPSSGPGGFAPGSQYLPGQGPSFPGQYPPGGNAPGQFPGGAASPYPSSTPGSVPSGPGAPPGSFPNLPYPGGQPAGTHGPGAGSNSFPGFSGAVFPPIPTGGWGPHGGGQFPGQPGHPGSFGPGSMGPYPNPSFGGQAPHGGSLDVPYYLPLQAGLMPRLMITIVGESAPNAERFHVDFVKGPDTVFHFNPRFNEHTVVRNANLRGRWGPEEREGDFPFVQGRRFEIKILVEEDMFKVAVDGAHLLAFEHRVGGLKEVTQLRIEGDIILYSVAPCMI
ncbi:galectin-3-like, partial [Arapaima gigas]